MAAAQPMAPKKDCWEHVSSRVGVFGTLISCGWWRVGADGWRDGEIGTYGITGTIAKSARWLAQFRGGKCERNKAARRISDSPLDLDKDTRGVFKG